MLTVVQCVNNMDVGGVEQLALSYAGALQGRGIRSLICCMEDRGSLADQAEANGIAVHALEIYRRGKLNGLRSLRALLRQCQPVVVHSHNFKPFYYASLATMLGATSGHIHTRHGALLQQHRAVWRYRLLRRWVDAWVTVSADRQTELAERTGLPLTAIHVLANGVDTARFCPATDKQTIRRQLSLSENVPAIMTAARLAPEKDFKTLLRAFAIVHQTIPTAELWFVGDGLERPALEALCRELKISSQVRFLGQRDNVDEFLKAADVFALSSLSEGLSVALIEAAASGLPIVATAVGGNGEVVKAPACGRLILVGNSPAFATALIEILRSEPLRTQMSQAARQHAIEHFSLDRMVDNYIDLYKQAVARRRSIVCSL